MSTHDVSVNGAAVDPLARIVEELQEALAPLTAQRAQLEAQLSDLAVQELRIKDALVALRVKPPRSTQDKRSKHAWTPSAKTIDDVYAALAKRDEPATTTQIAELMSVSRGTVDKALTELRRAERVRLCGTAGRGQAKLFAVMPSG